MEARQVSQRPFRAELQLRHRRALERTPDNDVTPAPAPAPAPAVDHIAIRDAMSQSLGDLRQSLAQDMETMLKQHLAKIEAGPAQISQAQAPAVPAPNDVSVNEISQLRAELGSLVGRIAQTKEEIASLVSSRMKTKRIEVVKDELGSVVADTEAATGIILDAMERVDAAAQHIKATSQQVVNQEWADEILDQVVRVFEACNFQDLTGQRINKVVNTLRFIEDKIGSIMKVVGTAAEAIDTDPGEPLGPDGLATTITKPRGQEERVSQDEIDAMFG